MKKLFIRILCLTLCALTILPIMAACNNNDKAIDGLNSNVTPKPSTTSTTETSEETTSEQTTESETSETTAETTKKPEELPVATGEARVNVTLDGKLLYSIVRDNDASSTLKTKINGLKSTLANRTGKSVTYRACNALIDRSADNQDYEILVGNTIRQASIDAVKDMQPKDYFVGVVGNKIVIAGGSDEATCEALDYFIEIITEKLKDVDDKDNISLVLSKEYTYTHRYPAKGMKIMGVDISNFAIRYSGGSVVDGDDVEKSAAKLNEIIGENSGVNLGYKLVNTVPEVKNEILLGAVARGFSLEFYSKDYEPLEYHAKAVDGKLYICGGSEWVIDYVVDYLIGRYFKAGLPITDTFEYKGNLRGEKLFDLEKNSNVRIMTNNVWNCDNNTEAWEAIGEDCSAGVRAKGLVTCYMAFEPDVINFQEMTLKMLDAVLQEFKNEGYSYAATETTKHVNIVYNTKTVELLNHGKYLYTYGNDGQSKGYAWAHFKHKATGKTFVSVSTHLWWKSEADYPGSDTYRANQANELATKCVELANTYQCPVFLGGDFNTRPLTTAYQNILDKGMKSCFDTALAKDDKGGHHSCGPEGFERGGVGKNEYAIDHMFHYNLGNCVLNSFRRTQPYFFIKLSDHYPIYVDVFLR